MINWKNQRIILFSPRLSLEPLHCVDAERVLSWINDEGIVRNFQFFTGELTLDDELQYIAKMSSSPTDILLGLFVGGVELIGTCGLHEIDLNNDTARLGVIIGKQNHWNQGYAKEAILALLHFAFEVMNLHKVYLNVFVTNERGVHLYGEVGFQTEGTLRKEYKIRGEYVDMYRMAILKEQFISQRGL